MIEAAANGNLSFSPDTGEVKFRQRSSDSSAEPAGVNLDTSPLRSTDNLGSPIGNYPIN